ncbi:MAG: RraA family protein [Caldicoprobacterales bacterium]|jgi:regulator of RNase E activity RraA|nr:RraA family protein [Clostridiales bacterium]
MRFNHREDIIQITPLWKGERMEDGRPKVPKSVLERLRKVTLEEAWGTLWRHGYKYQFEGDFKVINPDMVLVGRAVTGVMVPYRPDLNDTLLNYGHQEEGRSGYFNQWIIDSLVEDDVVVVDMFDKIYQGTFVGGNLTTAIAARTKRGGSVIWGGVRDTEQMMAIKNVKTYYRGNDPTGIGDVTLVSFNGPCRIGKAICLPGDVVLGTHAGVLFIPSHLAEECATNAEKSNIRDVWGFQMLDQGKYTTAQIDAGWTLDMWEDFLGWFETAPEAKDYQHLTWEKELEHAREIQGKEPKADIRL